MTIADLLMSQRRWGESRCRKLLAQLQISESKSLASLTDRQRQTLAAVCREQGAIPALSR
jgi:hypothetical protein